jgi:hypothetical protein
MSPTEEPKSAAAAQYPELEGTDGGWDPYVTSLLMSGARESEAADGDEDESVPVMSLSRAPQRR